MVSIFLSVANRTVFPDFIDGRLSSLGLFLLWQGRVAYRL